jgi:outer membrane protein TolC
MNRILADKLTERDVVLSVINGYFRLLQSARELRVSADAIAERQRFLEETKLKYEVGRVDESEILRAETSYLGELETAINRRRQLDEQREQLLLLLGLPLETPVSFIDITDYLAERGRVDIPSDLDVINEAREQRIELMQQDLSVALAEIDYQIQRNAVLPDLSIDGGYGRSDAADQIDSAFGYTDSAWDVGLALRVPLVNIQRREAARRARLTLDSELTNREQRERNITQEALNSRRNVLAAEAQLAVLIRNVERSRKSLELINGRFEVGFASITEVRLAQDDLFQSQTRYSNTLLNYQIALARLYVALGRPLL